MWYAAAGTGGWCHRRARNGFGPNGFDASGGVAVRAVHATTPAWCCGPAAARPPRARTIPCGTPDARRRSTASRRRSWPRAPAPTRTMCTPSAMCPPAARFAASSDSPAPSREPNVRFRECGDVQVATRSPTPARPASVAGLAPNAIPSRMISASPRVMIAATEFSPMPDAGRHAAGQRDDVLACTADLGADDVGVGVRAEILGGQRPLQRHRTTGVGAGDDGGRGLLLGDLAGQVGPGHDGHPRRVGAGHLNDHLAHPHQGVQLDALGQADQCHVVAEQSRPSRRGWPEASATAPRAAPCTRPPALRRRRWWPGSMSAVRRRRGIRDCGGWC